MICIRIVGCGEEVKMENDGGDVVNRLFDDAKEMNLSTILKKL